MQDRAIAQALQHRIGAHDIDQHGLGLQKARERFLIGGVDRGIAVELGEEAGEPRIALGGRRPIDMGNGNTGAGKIARETVEPDIDDTEARSEQRLT